MGPDAAPREGAAEPRLPGPEADGRRGEAAQDLGRAPRQRTRPQPAALQPRPPGAATAAALQTGDLRARFGSLRLGEAELLPAALVGARPGSVVVAHANWMDGHDAKHRAFVEGGRGFCKFPCGCESVRRDTNNITTFTASSSSPSSSSPSSHAAPRRRRPRRARPSARRSRRG